MKNILILFLTLIQFEATAQCITSPDSIDCESKNAKLTNYCGDINAYNTGGLTLLMQASYLGKSVVLIEQCLKRHPDIFQFAKWVADSSKTEFHTELNSCSFITFPSLACPGLEHVKDEQDELKILKLFIKYYPADSEKIYFYAFESLL